MTLPFSNIRNKRMISIIVNIAANSAIGFENKLLYWLPNDMKRFRQLTTGNTIIMGRLTFESLPKGALPNRRNIVLSRNSQAQFIGAETYGNLEDALAHCSNDEEIYIIGGATLYRQAIHLADRLCITRVDNTPKRADTYFPDIDPNEWKVESITDFPADEKHAYPYQFIDYVRK